MNWRGAASWFGMDSGSGDTNKLSPLGRLAAAVCRFRKMNRLGNMTATQYSSTTRFPVTIRPLALSTASYAATVLLATTLSAQINEGPVDLKAERFPLSDVRLLDGPFRQGQDLAVEYLLALEPDRLTANFRKEAGLEPKAPHYGGWEARGVSGHCGGHYISACALAYASTGDPRLLGRVNYMVDELAECQAAHGDGYVAAIPNGKQIYTDIAADRIRSAGFDLNGCWVPNYTLHKLFAGLRDAYRLCGSDRALQVERKLADWFEGIHADLTDDQMQKIMVAEHGGINETLADLYADTADKRYLRLSQRFHHKAILDPLAQGVDILPGKHANTQIPKLVGLAARYELTGRASDRAAAEFFWDRVVNHHSYVTGGHCDHEHFGQPDRLNDRLSPATTETCNVYNMLKLTLHVFSWTADPAVADFFERALLNHMRATQHPDGRIIYNLSLMPGHYKEYQAKFDSFTCCVGTGMENHVKYGEGIYFHDADGIWVNLFIASEVQWKRKGVALHQTTAWPDSDMSEFVVTCTEPSEWTLRIRHPYWATRGVQVLVNGEDLLVESKPSSYVQLRRIWKSGDRVTVTAPMQLRTESMPDNKKRIAVFHGPTVLAADLGPVDDLRASESFYVPVLLGGDRLVDEWVEPLDDSPGSFRTVDTGRPRDVELKPFHRLHDRRYTVYLDVFSPDEWKAREAELLADQRRRSELAARTVDVLRIGEMQPERAHNVKGERTGAGQHQGRKWRHAVDGGWFSFDMKVQADGQNTLVCTYWGSDRDGRVFDILIDEQKIATQELVGAKPGKFFDVTYAIPVELTEGRSTVTVKLRAHARNTAGGLFGVRVLKADADE
jgi:DUF1680 family protein